MAVTAPRTGGIAGETLRRPLPRELALAHISDLHVGKSARTDRSVRALAKSLVEQRVDHVVLTGDVTHGGRRREYDAFCRMFRSLSFGGRITLVPGNHDRLRQDVAARMTPGSRVWTVVREGLFLVCLDSTAPHNRSWIAGHGHTGEDDIARVAGAFARTPPGSLACLLLHHHLMPLPGDDLIERFVDWMGRPWVSELAAGAEMLRRIRGRCDLVLHGHRHVPSERVTAAGGRPLRIYNAGASPSLGRFRVFRHFAGRLLGAPEWHDVSVGRLSASGDLPLIGAGALVRA